MNCFAFLILLFSAATLSAGQLDLAVIRFGEVKDPSGLASALSRVRLSEIADADRTRTRESELKNGTVLFAQSLPVSMPTTFASATRLGNSRSDVRGNFTGGKLAVEISLSEGVAVGIRNFEKRNYEGSAAISAGPATILSIRETRSTAPTVVKGQSKMSTSTFTTIVAAQYTP